MEKIDLKLATDEDIFSLYIEIPKELTNRLIKLLDDNDTNICYFHEYLPDDMLNILLSDWNDNDVEKDKDYNIIAVGYTKQVISGNTEDPILSLYVISEDQRIWWDESIPFESMLDLYNYTKSKLKHEDENEII